MRLAYTEVHEPPIYKCFVAHVLGDESIILQEGETVDYRWLSYNEFLEFIKTDEFEDKSILRHVAEIEACLERDIY